MRKALFAIASLTLFVSSAFAAKPVLAVAEFRNDTSAGWWSSDVGNDLAGMLANELPAPRSSNSWSATRSAPSSMSRIWPTPAASKVDRREARPDDRRAVRRRRNRQRV